MGQLAGRVEGVLRLAASGRSPRGAVVFAYHDVVGDDEDPTDYAVRASTFERHLDATVAAGYRFVDAGVLVDLLLEGSPVDGLAAVTFDDALDGVRRNALPLLLERDVPATIFVVASVVGVSPPWWPGSGPVMSGSALSELAASGFTVGCHTATHRSLATLPTPELEQEITDARRALEDLVGRSVDLIAYPFGHYDREALGVVQQAGFRAGFTFLNGRVMPGLDPLRLPRFTMGEHHTPLRLRYHLGRPSSSWPDTQLDTVDGRESSPSAL